MKRATRNIVKGAGRELKGTVNQAAGQVAGKPGLRAKGTLQKAAGRVQRTVGQAEHDLENSERETE